MDTFLAYFHLPITNHTLVFLIVLAVILLAPMIFSKLRIPHLIGMILAGVLIGEHGVHLLERDTSFELFGTVGIYYIMFLAGLEMDLQGLKRNRRNGLIFGVLTALIPFACGIGAGKWMLSESWPTALLLGCILASHTLVSYPIVGRYNLGRQRSVTVSVAATMVALLFALIVLALLAGSMQGEVNVLFWLSFALRFALFALVLFVVYPYVIPRFFRTFSDHVMQFTFVLALMLLAAATAELCGLEGILGAFLAGLVFNRFIPRSTPLMNRVEFVGNALFIPYFLIGVGMLVNLRPLFTSKTALGIVAIMVVVGTLSKLLAAFLARQFFGMKRREGLMMFGLTEAHAAGALAMVMVGTRLEVAPGVPLMGSSMLDGVVVMILLSCIIASISTDQAARQLRLLQESSDLAASEKRATDDEKIMLPINEDDTLPQLLQTAIMMRNSLLNRGLICLNIVNDDDTTGLLMQHSKECLQRAERICSAADVSVQTQSRLAVNFVNGTIHAFRENDASELILGLHRRRSNKDSLLGTYTQGLVSGIDRQITIVGYKMPPNTFAAINVAVPHDAQFEPGFYRWVERLARLAIEIGCRIVFHAAEQTAGLIREYLTQTHPLVRDEYQPFDTHSDLPTLIRDHAADQLLVLVLARRGTISHEKWMNHLQELLLPAAEQLNLMLLYPDQEGDAPDTTSFTQPHITEAPSPSRLSLWMSKWIRKIG